MFLGELKLAPLITKTTLPANDSEYEFRRFETLICHMVATIMTVKTPRYIYFITQCLAQIVAQHHKSQT